jgi:hypothetical protein
MSLPAITLTQPWATLMALGAKRVETRSWPTAYRGPLAIHAGKNLKPVGGLPGLRWLCATPVFERTLAAHRLGVELLPLGAVIAVGELVDVKPVEEIRGGLDEDELAFGDYSNGRYGWIFERLRPTAAEIHVRGALGLWPLPEHLLPALGL